MPFSPPTEPYPNFPYSPTLGAIVFGDGTQQTTAALGTSTSTVYIGSSAPVSPYSGQLWYDTTDGRLYVRYSNAWVDTSTNAGTNALIYTGATPPASPIANELWFNTEDGKIYIRYNDTWIDTSVPAGSGYTLPTATTSTLSEVS